MMEDPYDDFDPRDYSYCTDEEADDVVYKETEGSVDASWAPPSLQLSQGTAMSQQSQLRVPITNLAPRNERKRQRQQLAPFDHESSSSSPEHENEEEDIFASVRSIIERKLEKSKEPHSKVDRPPSPDELPAKHFEPPLESLDLENREKVSSETQKQSHASHRARDSEKDAESAKDGIRVHEIEKAGIPSSEIGAANDMETELRDEHIANEDPGSKPLNDCSNTRDEPSAPPSDEENQRDTDKHSDELPIDLNQLSLPWKTSSSISTHIESELKRQRVKQKQSKPEQKEDLRYRGGCILEDSTHQSHAMLVALEKARKRVQGDGSSKRDDAEKRGDKRRPRFASLSQGRYQRRTTGNDYAAGTQGVIESLIGARPSHWGLQSSQNEKRLLSRAAQLAKATRSRKPRNDGKKRSSQSRADNDAIPPTQRTNANETQQRTDRIRATRRREQNHSAWKPMTDTSTLTFTPAFLKTVTHPSDSVSASNESSQPTPPLNGHVLQTPAIQRRGGGGSPMFSGGSSGGHPNSSSPRRKTPATSARKRLQAGPLMKRLRSIRGTVEGDWVRLQSGMYPFHKSRRHDMNDPRNRANTYMDVTITGDPVCWKYKNQMLTMLGFIHSHVHKHKNTTGMCTSDTASGNDSIDAQSSGVNEGGGLFAWICFDYDTARDKKIQRWSQLRIYNAITMPLHQSLEIPGCCPTHKTQNQTCDKLVLCTKLCEPYPDSLPQLDGVCTPSR